MKLSSVLCLAPNETEAVQMVERLKSAGIENDDIAVLLPREAVTAGAFAEDPAVRPIVHEHHTKAGAALGALLGAALGWFASTGSLALPGSSLLVAAGPVLASLGAALVGAVSGIASVVVCGVLAHALAEHHARHSGRLHHRLRVQPGR